MYEFRVVQSHFPQRSRRPPNSSSRIRCDRIGNATFRRRRECEVLSGASSLTRRSTYRHHPRELIVAALTARQVEI